jgi:two-component system sensor histidine kinase KdpD
MREAAHEVQARQQEENRERAQSELDLPAPHIAAPAPAAIKERILALITADPATAMLIRRGRRVADYLHGDCLALYVHREEHFGDLPEQEREAVERHLNFARNLRIETRIVYGEDIARTVVDFAHRNQVTQLFLSRSLQRYRPSFLRGNLIRNLIRLARDIQVTVVAVRRRADES